MKKSIMSIGAAFLPVLMVTQVQAASIGVIRENVKKFVIKDSDGVTLSSQTFETGSNRIQRNFTTLDISIFDLQDHEGAEWIAFGDEQIVHRQLGDGSDQYSLVNGTAVGAVGNLSDDYTGSELVACTQYTTTPRIKIYSYDDSSRSVSQIESFKPFGTGTSTNRGCGSVAIGDVDGDGTNEIVTIKLTSENKGTDPKVKILDLHGNVVGSFTLSDSTYTWAAQHDNPWEGKVFVQDLDEDGSAEIIFQGDSTHVYVYDMEGTQLSVIDVNELDSGKEIVKIDVADVTDDGVADIVVQENGMTVPILVLNSDGTLNKASELFPNASVERNRYIYLGDWSTSL